MVLERWRTPLRRPLNISGSTLWRQRMPPCRRCTDAYASSVSPDSMCRFASGTSFASAGQPIERRGHRRRDGLQRGGHPAAMSKWNRLPPRVRGVLGNRGAHRLRSTQQALTRIRCRHGRAARHSQSVLLRCLSRRPGVPLWQQLSHASTDPRDPAAGLRSRRCRPGGRMGGLALPHESFSGTCKMLLVATGSGRSPRCRCPLRPACGQSRQRCSLRSPAPAGPTTSRATENQGAAPGSATCPPSGASCPLH